MHFFKWLTDKAGKMPVTIAQAAGLTAVVGAAGFAALSYLNTPADNNNTFMPPSQYGGDVVYVSQNTGGGSYESNGEVGSSFKAAPSRAIQLANRQEEQERLTRALEESSGQPYSGGATDESGASLQMPKAYELSGVDVGLGMGGNKNAAGSFDVLTSAQNQLSGLGDLVAKAAQSAGAGQPGAAGTQPGGAQAPAAPGAAA